MSDQKKVVILFDPEPAGTFVMEKPAETVTYEIVVAGPEGYPTPMEAVQYTKNVPGGILWCGSSFIGKPSFLNPETDKVALTLTLIREFDKGEEGVFTAAYFLECDRLTPELRQYDSFKEYVLRIATKKDIPEEDFKTLYGNQMRSYLRGIAFRLFSYYFMGYNVSFVLKEEAPVSAPVPEQAEVPVAPPAPTPEETPAPAPVQVEGVVN